MCEICYSTDSVWAFDPAILCCFTGQWGVEYVNSIAVWGYVMPWLGSSGEPSFAGVSDDVSTDSPSEMKAHIQWIELHLYLYKLLKKRRFSGGIYRLFSGSRWLIVHSSLWSDYNYCCILGIGTRPVRTSGIKRPVPIAFILPCS